MICVVTLDFTELRLLMPLCVNYLTTVHLIYLYTRCAFSVGGLGRLVTHIKDDLAQAWNWQQQSVACMVVRLGRMYQSRSDVLSDRKVLAEFS